MLLAAVRSHLKSVILRHALLQIFQLNPAFPSWFFLELATIHFPAVDTPFWFTFNWGYLLFRVFLPILFVVIGFSTC